MITEEQQKWLEHLSDTGSVKIAPFDPSVEQKFKTTKKQIKSILGTTTIVLHRGASALGISGQPEIDIYIPVPPDNFNKTVIALQQEFGKPYSAYELERTKFIRAAAGTKLEIMVVNEFSKSWNDNETFFSYIKKHPEDLERYRLLKEEAAGLSNRAYYRKKIEFINEILDKAK